MNDLPMIGDTDEFKVNPTTSGLKTRPLFKLMVERKASDLFFTSHAPIKIKIEGQIHSINKQVLSPDAVRAAAFGLMTPEQIESFQRELENRFRDFRAGVSAGFALPSSTSADFPRWSCAIFTADMPRLDQLGVPDLLVDLAKLKRGLILMVGATGSGKSTTLAAMINYRNEHFRITSSPSRIRSNSLHSNKRSIINQREVGLDTRSYARALRAVMRAAPDVILIGEIRDRESMEAAIGLAGTGHLVLATLHANNCAETLDRIINMFDHAQHPQVLLDLSQYLRCIMAQRLVPGGDGKRVAAVEVMLNTPHVSELIRKGDVSAIKEAIINSAEKGIQSFDYSLVNLYKAGRISLDDALAVADSRSNLEARINFG